MLLDFNKFKEKTTMIKMPQTRLKRNDVSSPYEEYCGGGSNKIKQWSTSTTQLPSAYRIHRMDSDHTNKQQSPKGHGSDSIQTLATNQSVKNLQPVTTQNIIRSKSHHSITSKKGQYGRIHQVLLLDPEIPYQYAGVQVDEEKNKNLDLKQQSQSNLYKQYQQLKVGNFNIRQHLQMAHFKEKLIQQDRIPIKKLRDSVSAVEMRNAVEAQLNQLQRTQAYQQGRKVLQLAKVQARIYGGQDSCVVDGLETNRNMHDSIPLSDNQITPTRLGKQSRCRSHLLLHKSHKLHPLKHLDNSVQFSSEQKNEAHLLTDMGLNHALLNLGRRSQNGKLNERLMLSQILSDLSKKNKASNITQEYGCTGSLSKINDANNTSILNRIRGGGQDNVIQLRKQGYHQRQKAIGLSLQGQKATPRQGEALITPTPQIMTPELDLNALYMLRTQISSRKRTVVFNKQSLLAQSHQNPLIQQPNSLPSSSLLLNYVFTNPVLNQAIKVEGDDIEYEEEPVIQKQQPPASSNNIKFIN